MTPSTRHGAFIVSQDQVLPEFLDAFTTYVCPHVPNCLRSSVVVPPPHEQLTVLMNLRTIQAMYPIDGFDGLVLFYLMAHDGERLNMLISTILELRENEHVIQHLASIAFPSLD